MKKTLARRAAALFIVCMLCFLLGPPLSAGAQSADLLSYEDAVTRLGSISLTDEDALDLLNRSFAAVGARSFAPQYKYLTAALLELSGSESADFASVDTVILLLGQNTAFVDSYREIDSLSCLSPDALRKYVQGRRLETQGDFTGAYQAYMEGQILDSLDRAMTLVLQGSVVAAEPTPNEPESPGVTVTPDTGEVNTSAAATDEPVLEGDATGDTPRSETPAPTAAAVQTLEPRPTPGPVPWPTYTLKTYKLTVADTTSNKMSYSGPSKNYSEAGCYVPSVMARTDGLFVEDRYVLVDMNYTSIGLRRVYFRCGIFKSTYNVPEAALTRYPAVTTQEVTAWYGPGTKYNKFPEASLGANAPITVFFEEDGYVFAEYDTAFRLVRAWIDAAYVTPE